MTRFRQSWPWWRWVLVGMILLTLLLSIYLSWHYLTGGSMIGCGGGSPCDQVLSSRWSTIGNVLPVSGLAAGAYLAMLVASFYIGPSMMAPVRQLAWCMMLVLVGAITGSAVWFIVLQKWIIGAFCPYCMTAHITGLLIAAMVIWRAHVQLKIESITPRRAIGLVMTGLALTGILVTCQVFFAPQAIYRNGQSQLNLPPINPHIVPLVGSPDAQYVVTLLFDYKCSHCQQLHFMLNEVVRRYNGKLAFALCPAPLNSKCNPYVPRDVDEYKDSCELAKVGLAVWVARREAFPVFEQWMFLLESGDRWRPRSLDTATAKAVELVGQAKFDDARIDPWIDQYMQTSIRIYGTTVQNSNAIPRLVFGDRWVVPGPHDADNLVLILQDSLKMPRPDL